MHFLGLKFAVQGKFQISQICTQVHSITVSIDTSTVIRFDIQHLSEYRQHPPPNKINYLKNVLLWL